MHYWTINCCRVSRETASPKTDVQTHHLVWCLYLWDGSVCVRWINTMMDCCFPGWLISVYFSQFPDCKLFFNPRYGIWLKAFWDVASTHFTGNKCLSQLDKSLLKWILKFLSVCVETRCSLPTGRSSSVRSVFGRSILCGWLSVECCCWVSIHS